MVEKRKVELALAAEAKKLTKRYSGTHIFDAPRQVQGSPNWTSTFHCRGSKAPLDEMRDALERVQAKLPEIDWR